MREAAGRLVAAGAATAYLLEIAGAAAAGRLVLHANRVSYFFSLTGFDPAWWHAGVATTLVAECLRLAIARGDTLANLSIGPNTAKLRWSEEVCTYHDFVLASARRR